MSPLQHFHRNHSRGGRLGSQSWWGRQGGWQCIPDVDDYYDGDDDDDSGDIMTVVIMTVMMMTVMTMTVMMMPVVMTTVMMTMVMAMIQDQDSRFSSKGHPELQRNQQKWNQGIIIIFPHSKKDKWFQNPKNISTLGRLVVDLNDGSLPFHRRTNG